MKRSLSIVSIMNGEQQGSFVGNSQLAHPVSHSLWMRKNFYDDSTTCEWSSRRDERFYSTTFPPFRSIYLIVKPNAPCIIQIFLPFANIVSHNFLLLFSPTQGTRCFSPSSRTFVFTNNLYHCVKYPHLRGKIQIFFKRTWIFLLYKYCTRD